MPIFTVPPDAAPQPLKTYLRGAGVSSTLWRKIKYSQSLRINGAPVHPTLASVRAGDAISYELASSCAILPQNLPLSIRYEDEYLLVADKPAGQLVHPTGGRHEGTLANAVVFHCLAQGQPPAFHPVHRLDKDTSGLVLIAKQPQIQHQLSAAGHTALQRVYLALAAGRLQPAHGTIDAPIARRPGSIIERTVAPDGRPAVTHYRTLRADARFSLLELTLETGRTHQIRVHLAHIGHPLLGDDLYGGDARLLPRQALHAARLCFLHPATRQMLDLQSPLPPDLQQLAASLPEEL